MCPRNDVLDGIQNPDPPWHGTFFGGGVDGRAKGAELIKLPFGMVMGGLKESCIRWVCTLAPPGKYGWTIVRGGYRVGIRLQRWRRICAQITFGNFVMPHGITGPITSDNNGVDHC